MARTRPSVAGAIGWGGLIVGILDITDALVFTWFRGVAPVRVLYAIASGVLGREALAGGSGVAALGLALHFFIAYTVTTVYVLASRRLALLVRHAIPLGMVYGLGVTAVMQFIVLPLAGLRGGIPASPVQALNLVFAHLFCVGLPIGVVTRRYLGAP